MAKYDLNFIIDNFTEIKKEKELKLSKFEDEVFILKDEIYTIECSILKIKSMIENERSL